MTFTLEMAVWLVTYCDSSTYGIGQALHLQNLVVEELVNLKIIQMPDVI